MLYRTFSVSKGDSGLLVIQPGADVSEVAVLVLNGEGAVSLAVGCAGGSAFRVGWKLLLPVGGAEESRLRILKDFAEFCGCSVPLEWFRREFGECAGSAREPDGKK